MARLTVMAEKGNKIKIAHISAEDAIEGTQIDIGGEDGWTIIKVYASLLVGGDDTPAEKHCDEC